LNPLQKGYFTDLRTNNGASARMNQVLVHRLNISNTPTIDTAPIPTMSEWGLLVFSLLVLNLGVFFIYKKERLS